MTEKIIIVAQTENRVIGKNNAMPWHLPKDLRHFKATTLGYPVIMGRNTYHSIGKALPGRQNFVITRNPDYQLEDAIVCHALEDAVVQCNSEKLFLIGGASLYEQYINSVDTLIVTWIHTTISGGDAFFPVIDKTKWQETERNFSPKDEKNAYDLSFVTYQHIH